MCKTLVDEWVTVTDDEICRAILLLLEGEKTVAEGAGASAVAALLAGKINHQVALFVYFAAQRTIGQQAYTCFNE